MARRSNILFKSVGAAALLLAATSLSAQAADLPIVQPASHDWTGPYIGAIVGVGGYDTSGYFDQDDDSDSVVNLGALGDVGVLGGGTVGWNIQSGNTVFGIEGDISATSLKRSAEEQDFSIGHQITFDTDYFATIRGRIGLADNDVLLYATGGVAFLGASLKNPSEDESMSVDAVGGVVGAGIEWAASSNISVKVEGLYAFMNEKVDLEGRLVEGDTGDAFKLNDVVTARIGVNWHFNGNANSSAYDTDETVHDWSGPYIGGTLGGAAWTTSGYYDSTDTESMMDLGALGSVGLLGGGTVGWNILTANNMLWGIEGDVSFVDWSAKTFEGDFEGNRRLEFDADLLATMRGRVGHIDGDLLFYGTGGFAWLVGTFDDGGSGETDDSLDVLATGLVVGAGMEWAATETVSVKVEGLYVSFNKTYDMSDFGEGDSGDALKMEDAAIARLGVNWNFR